MTEQPTKTNNVFFFVFFDAQHLSDTMTSVSVHLQEQMMSVLEKSAVSSFSACFLPSFSFLSSQATGAVYMCATLHILCCSSSHFSVNMDFYPLRGAGLCLCLLFCPTAWPYLPLTPPPQPHPLQSILRGFILSLCSTTLKKH